MDPKPIHLREHLSLALFLLLLFTEYPPTHCEHGFESFPTFPRVLGEPGHTRLLNSILNLLPPTTQSRDFGVLYELRSRGGERLIDDGLPYAEDV